MIHNANTQARSRRKMDVVLGAGGIKGFAHMGFLRALREKNIPIGKLTGVSVGALVAALYTNGYTEEEITKIFLERLSKRFDPLLIAQCFGMPDLLSFMIGGCIDLSGPLREMVKTYKLRPNPNLRILAYDAISRKPVLFKGEDYDLALALYASCAMPGVLMPAKYPQKGGYSLLVDGAMFHRNPGKFSRSPAIISRLGFATEPCKEYGIPADLYFHIREMYTPLFHQPTEVDEKQHIVATTKASDVAGLNFGISPKRCLRLVEEGHAAGIKAIDKAIASGKLKASC